MPGLSARSIGGSAGAGRRCAGRCRAEASARARGTARLSRSSGDGWLWRAVGLVIGYFWLADIIDLNLGFALLVMCAAGIFLLSRRIYRDTFLVEETDGDEEDEGFEFKLPGRNGRQRADARAPAPARWAARCGGLRDRTLAVGLPDALALLLLLRGDFKHLAHFIVRTAGSVRDASCASNRMEGWGRRMALRGLGICFFRQLPVVRRETQHPASPHIVWSSASDKAVVSCLCRRYRRRRAGRGCSATILDNTRSLGRPSIGGIQEG